MAVSGEPPPTYPLDGLGWVQFERLVDEVLAREEISPAWEGRADTCRVATLDDGSGVAVLWVRALAREQLTRASLLAQLTITLAAELPSTKLRLFTNLDLDDVEARSLVGDGTYFGPRELSRIIDATPLIRRRVPSVLGLRDLGELIPTATLERSTADHDAMRELSRVFVPTRAYDRALSTLERHSFAVLTGPPEMGKTAIARTLSLALMTETWEAHECTRPDELWARLAPDMPQVFIADDAFGSTEYRPEAGERWALDLDRILRAMDERHWLVWTSRPAPLKAALRRVHREHGVERWPQPAEIHVAADALGVEEKAMILFRHARAAELAEEARDVVQRLGWEIISHEHFTPERIRRFVAGRLRELPGDAGTKELAGLIAEEIREPTAAMAASLRALSPEHLALLVALLDVPPGFVPERELAAAVRRHTNGGMPKPPAELVDRLTDHFLRVVGAASVTWVHPSWRDLVIDDLAADAGARRAFLSRCSLDGMLLALSTGGGVAGERSLPFFVDDADWDAVADRQRTLLAELDEDGAARLLAALGAAIGAVREERPAHELRALAAESLVVVQRRWDSGRVAITPTLLERWLVLRAGVADPPPVPDLSAAWARLEPAAAPDVHSPAELMAFDDWLRFGGILRARLPDLQRRFNFPLGYLDVIRMFVWRARRLLDRAKPAPNARLVADVLRRVEEVAPNTAPEAHSVARRLVPEGIATTHDEPSLRAEPPRVVTDVVRRILGDL